MQEGIKRIEIDKYEAGIILNALKQYKESQPPEVNVDSIRELILKIIDTEPKKVPFYKKLEER